MRNRKLGFLLVISVCSFLMPSFLLAKTCPYKNSTYKLANKDGEILKPIVIPRKEGKYVGFKIDFPNNEINVIYLPILGNVTSYEIIPIKSVNAPNLYSPQNHDIRFDETNFIGFNERMEKAYDFPSPDIPAPKYIYIPGLIDKLYKTFPIKNKLYDGLFVLSACSDNT
ncbi:hypothetical protein [Acetobacter tropicalis]|uniref:hypothetical protein n=1 Tax=Acetobacter tropicalis TaxID=104102 RepID=UPI000B1BAF24|nr:hypothetical protein [Acetobacter tropicalis]